jgi:hypothetical protein
LTFDLLTFEVNVSYYEALPIYRSALDLASAVDRAEQRFPKGHKFTLGSRLRDTTIDIGMLIAAAGKKR